MKYFILLSILSCSTIASAQQLGCNNTRKHSVFLRGQVSFFDTAYRGRGPSDHNNLWNAGTTIRVKFLSGSKMLQEKIQSAAKEWELFANVKFNFNVGGNSQIRIHLTTGQGHWSYVGLSSYSVNQDEPTMVLDTVDIGNSLAALKTVVQHQFGHVLGLQHEHSSPVSGLKWAKSEIFIRYQKWGFSKKEVIEEIFMERNLSYTNGTAFDNKSIMTSPVFPWQTIDGFSIPWNRSISNGDKQTIAALYPKPGERNTGAVTTMATGSVGISVLQNQAKNGLSFFPNIDIQSNGETSKIYICVLIYDENGNPLPDDDGNYAFGTTVAAGRTTTLIADTRLVANKNNSKDYELFIPYSQIPLEEGQQNIKVQLIVVQVRTDGETKTLHRTDAVSYKMNYSDSPLAKPVEITFPSAKKKTSG